MIQEGIDFKQLNLNEMLQFPGVNIPADVSSKPTQKRYLMVKDLDIQLLATNLHTEKSKQLVREIIKLAYVVHCYQKDELAIARKQVVNLRWKSAEMQKGCKTLTLCFVVLDQKK